MRFAALTYRIAGICTSMRIPVFETARLRMRGHTTDDFNKIERLWGDPRVTEFIGVPQTPEESWSRLLRYAGHWTLMSFGYWVVEERGSGEFVGEVGLSNFRRNMDPSLGETPELGWAIAPEKQGLGYATEAVTGALTWARENVCKGPIASIIRPDHERSVNVATKCGFRMAFKATYKGIDLHVFEKLVIKGDGI